MKSKATDLELFFSSTAQESRAVQPGSRARMEREMQGKQQRSRAASMLNSYF